MAYVRKTQTLVDDVANTVSSMMHAELGKLKKANDVSIGTRLSKDKLIPVVKEYYNNFNGNLLGYVYEESGCVYIWYQPLNKFITFYCP